MKRTVTLLALLAALCCLLTVSAAAESTIVDSGTCGENLTWTLDGAGTLRIAGEGAMGEYSTPWKQSRDNIKTVVIERGVTAIGGNAFRDCSILTSVTFAGDSQLTIVGNYAFCDCSSLTNITIPESVTSIGTNAFDSCKSLTNITIPRSVKVIGEGAFRSCLGLTDVNITDMDAWCRIDFGGSTATPMYCANNIWLNGQKIVSATVPEGVTELNYTFYRFKDLIQVTLPKSLTGIGEETFYQCTSLTNVDIPEGVSTIGDSAFDHCSSLTSITLPKGLTEIGDSAFSSCSNLTSVDVPEGVTTIGSCALAWCRNLTSINLPERITLIENSLFSMCNSLTTINIPESVTAIGDGAFDNCSSLVSINIPEGVTEIGSDAFRSCIRLSSVYISNLDAWYSINFGYRFANPFYYAQNLYLNGELVESLEIPQGIQVVPAGLFRSAACLKRVSIPRSLAGVAANAFENCTNITEVFYEGSESEWAALPISAGNDPLKNAPNIYFNSTLDNYYCRIAVAVSDGGRVTVDHTTAKVGDTVTVTAAPYQGYELTAICVDGAAIEGNTFTVTGNHVVSARFTRVPVVGGTEDFRLEGLSVRTAAGKELQELPQGSLLVTVAVQHLNENGSGTILLAQYDSQGRYRGLMWLTLDEMPQGMTLRVTLPVDNSSGEIANLKVFVVEDLTSPLPVGTPVSFGQV